MPVILEHSFVITGEDEQAVRRLQSLIAALDLCGDAAIFLPEHRLERPYKRCPDSSAAKAARDLQWRVALLLDRKRVKLTCSMEPRGRERRMHRDLCLALANAIELRLAHDAPEEECLAVWEQAAAVVDRSMRRHRLAFLLIVLLFFAPLAIVAVAALILGP